VESNTFLYLSILTGIGTFLFITGAFKFFQLQSGMHQCFHIPCGENRTIWVLKPTAKFGLIKTLWMAREIQKHLPRRLEPEIIDIPVSHLSPKGNKMYAFSHVNSDNEIVYSYTLAGTHKTASIDEKAYSVIKTWNTDRKTKINAAQFNQLYGGTKKWDPLEVSLAILAVTYVVNHRKGLDYVRPPSTTHYTYKPEDYDCTVDEKPATDQYFDGCTRGLTHIPIKCKGNTAHSIKTRVTDVKPTLPTITRKQQKLITEFLVEYRKEVDPTRITSYDEVLLRQTRPIQRISNEQAMDILPWVWLKITLTVGKLTKSFQKQEASTKPGDPRNITPMPDKVRLENSRISYPLAENMKKTKWYSFGMMPAAIARAVALYVSDPRTKTIGLGDYSRMDGTVNHLVRTFDLAFLHANFDTADHEFIDEWYSLTYGNYVNAGWGEKYEQGDSQASGDPYTSCLNTARNAFIQFCCAREDLQPAGAYDNLGLAAGDDSIQRNVNPDTAVNVAKSWGFVLKFATRLRGQTIDYLSRQYSPAVWMGSPDNIACPLRLISKFHVSRLATKVPAYVLAYTKAVSVMTNDHSTYLLSSWMRKIIRQTSVQARAWIKQASTGAKCELTRERQWAARTIDDSCGATTASSDFSNKVSYQTEMNLDYDWQIQVFIDEGFSVTKMEDFIEWCDDPNTDWRDCPVLYEREAIKTALPYLANGEIVGPSEAAPDTPDIVVLQANSSMDLKHSEPPVQMPREDNIKLDVGDIKQLVKSFTAEHHRKPKGAQGSESKVQQWIKSNLVKEKKKKKTESVKFSDVLNSCQTYPCRRGDNCKGWYAGLKPCRVRVNEVGKFCGECHNVYLAKSKTN
jgi:hypothetical protein